MKTFNMFLEGPALFSSLFFLAFFVACGNAAPPFKSMPGVSRFSIPEEDSDSNSGYAARPGNYEAEEDRLDIMKNPSDLAVKFEKWLESRHERWTLKSHGDSPAETPEGSSKLFSWITCDLCKASMLLFQTLIGEKATQKDIEEAVVTVCTTLRIETSRVCRGVAQEFAPELFTVLGTLVLSPNEACGVLFGPTCGDAYDPYNAEWNVTFPSTPQPKPVYPTPPKKGSPTFKVLHLTDMHVDNQYKVGSNAKCGEPLCCRDGDDGKDGAWKFGDYRNCDTPLWTLENLLSHLSAQKDSFDYIIWTGDLPAHNIWNQSRDDQKAVLAQAVDLMVKYFPGKPIFPSLGNHESSPVNSYPPDYIKGENSIAWLYDALAASWMHWLPADSLKTVKTGGYYSVSPSPQFRIISLNINYCNNMNWWMLLNTTDPNGELHWLVDTLQEAEDKKEKVHILGHIPVGSGDCLKAWSWNYYKIVSRYQNTIAAQFFGHTHHDSFTVYYDEETLKIPISTAYVAPSVTSFSNQNMGYRFYTVDGWYNTSSFQILDHETHYLNLTKANLEGKITWEFEYSAKAAYDMENLFPKDWDNLITRMKTNSTLLDKYNKYYLKSRYPDKSCDKSCRSDLLCESKSGRSHDPSLCKDLGINNHLEFYALPRNSGKKDC